jgi:hypothetical protein
MDDVPKQTEQRLDVLRSWEAEGTNCRYVRPRVHRSSVKTRSKRLQRLTFIYTRSRRRRRRRRRRMSSAGPFVSVGSADREAKDAQLKAYYQRLVFGDPVAHRIKAEEGHARLLAHREQRLLLEGRLEEMKRTKDVATPVVECRVNDMLARERFLCDQSLAALLRQAWAEGDSSTCSLYSERLIDNIASMCDVKFRPARHAPLKWMASDDMPEDEIGEEATCSVCLEGISWCPSLRSVLNCGHTYHSACLNDVVSSYEGRGHHTFPYPLCRMDHDVHTYVRVE